MVNFHDPAILARDFSATVKLWHAISGLYFWEFFTTLDYEWDVIRGRRPYLWTIWIYSLTRVTTLIALALLIAGFNTSDPHACRAWITGHLVFAYVAIAAASFLIVIRVASIWNRRAVIMAIAIGVWGTNVCFLIYGAWRLHPAWIPAADTCSSSNVQSNKATVISILATDIVLLLMMLMGLHRLRFNGGGMLHLGSFLWKQGIIWLSLATIAEVPPAVFISLNLNDVFSIMFQLPALVTMTIAATRMYRSLVTYFDNFTDFVQDSDKGNGGAPVLTVMQAHDPHVPLNGTAATGCIACTQYSTSSELTSHRGSSFGTDRQGSLKPSESTSEEDLEKGVDKLNNVM